ncbi:hypothetical protein CCP1ISM_250015 [Azospirillaceae bacterium]
MIMKIDFIEFRKKRTLIFKINQFVDSRAKDLDFTEVLAWQMGMEDIRYPNSISMVEEEKRIDNLLRQIKDWKLWDEYRLSL